MRPHLSHSVCKSAIRLPAPKYGLWCYRLISMKSPKECVFAQTAYCEIISKIQQYMCAINTKNRSSRHLRLRTGARCLNCFLVPPHIVIDKTLASAGERSFSVHIKRASFQPLMKIFRTNQTGACLISSASVLKVKQIENNHLKRRIRAKKKLQNACMT